MKKKPPTSKKPAPELCLVCRKKPAATLGVQKDGTPYFINAGACNAASCVRVRMRECL